MMNLLIVVCDFLKLDENCILGDLFFILGIIRISVYICGRCI